MIKRGALIVLEGCDKSGKSTQCKMLLETLQNKGIAAELFRFPDRDTPIGKMCSEYLKMNTELEDHAIHLLFTANRWENIPKMLKLLNNGITLIVDRYSFSGIAFSSFKKNMNMDWCKTMETGLLKPDAVYYLDVNKKNASKRGGYGDERFENVGDQSKIADIYSKFKSEDFWNVIDANQSVKDVHSSLVNHIVSVIKRSENKEISRLWHRDIIEL